MKQIFYKITYEYLPLVLVWLCSFYVLLMQLTGKGADRDLLIVIAMLLVAHYVRGEA